ncbi:MAG: hypothetical protein JJE49_05515 [Peptostreptococcaceae bacterium]|nr:hypothetical protein [Peptostreptococcaceae bacterium]
MVKRAFFVFCSAKSVNSSYQEQTKVDIGPLAARFVDPALWNKAVQDEGEDNLDQFYLFGGMGINSHVLDLGIVIK